MMNKSKIIRFLSLNFVLIGFVLMSGSLIKADAQTRDPFDKPSWAKPRTGNPTTTSSGQPKAQKPKPPGPPPVVAVLAPSIEQRINYYKRLREDAALSGQEIPKVTSVLTLDEMSVTGIFRTPRGYAAMVEAKPIKLSYTIYPGEKFFDGQLVAVEENRLVFRKVIKMSDGKFIAAVENKTLRQYTVQEEVQGTAPIQPSSGKTEEANNTVVVPKDVKEQTITPSLIISPLDEMNKQPAEQPKDAAKEKTDKKKDAAKEKTDKKDKKPVKVAKNKKN
ncbi:MAG: hypothetical protein ACR2MG_20130 [Pyrinomonadaceae bacterium]